MDTSSGTSRRVARTLLLPVAVKSTAGVGDAEIGLPILSQGLDCLWFEVATRGVGRVEVHDVCSQDWQNALVRLCRYR